MNALTRAAVVALTAEKRFEFFVRKVADLEEVWGLHGQGWATAEGGGGMVALPFWPERDFAAACAIGVWENDEPRAVPLADFLTSWLPGMIRESQMVAVFPTDHDGGLLTAPDDLLEAIHRELWQAAAR